MRFRARLYILILTKTSNQLLEASSLILVLACMIHHKYKILTKLWASRDCRLTVKLYFKHAEQFSVELNRLNIWDSYDAPVVIFRNT